MSNITKYKINIFCILLSIICSTVLMCFFWNLQVIPQKYKVIATILMVLFNLLLWLFLYFAHRRLTRNLVRTAMILFSLVCLTLSFVTSFGWNKVNTTIENIVDNTITTRETVYVYVKEKSPYLQLSDLEDKRMGLIEEGLIVNQEYAFSEIQKTIGIDAYYNSDIYKIIDELANDECDAILIDEGYLPFVVETYINFEKNYRSIHTISWDKKSVEPAVKDITQEPFNIYISGIDTYGAVSQKSRSDVNMIVSINPVMKQILLVTTPRDYYVESTCLQSKRDKLTHCGMYGINCSINTLENLYEIELDFYVRMNFSGMQTIIDALGGVEVEVSRDFCLDGICLEKGKQQLNGKEALMFARERHSLPNGDFDRAKNQQQVIRAIINKMMSVTMLTNFDSILSSVAQSLQTNLPKEDILSLVTMQMNDLASWKISNLSADGENAYQTTASIGDLMLFVVMPDPDSIAEIQAKIQAVHDGKMLEE